MSKIFAVVIKLNLNNLKKKLMYINVTVSAFILADDSTFKM